MGIYIIDLFALLFAIGVGFGLSCWILGTLLENSNSFGDNKGDKRYYKAYAKFSTRKDGLNTTECNNFCYSYGKNISKDSDGPDGQEPVRKLTDEEIAFYNHTSVEEAAREREERIKDLEDSFNIWESRNAKGSLSGVFAKLDEEEQKYNQKGKKGVSRR